MNLHFDVVQENVVSLNGINSGVFHDSPVDPARGPKYDPENRGPGPVGARGTHGRAEHTAAEVNYSSIS